ncbi:hypothetical protein SAMN02910456_00389 [Ruminococcaceae bacterium YRB3002]|nr:hypothetical protein SAMN02910456_00389 [Ruminococcaceae bacterium YRB3002]
MSQCDTCLFHAYDELSDDYYCDCNMDEDEMAGMAMNGLSGLTRECPYYRDGDEYKTVRHQM